MTDNEKLQHCAFALGLICGTIDKYKNLFSKDDIDRLLEVNKIIEKVFYHQEEKGS